jgi:hypothetical protein
MKEDRVEEMLAKVLGQTLGLSREREEGMWERFAARCRRESAGWAAFAAVLAAFSLNMRPAVRACSWPAERYLSR